MFFYTTYPFINGLGCDFTADAEDNTRIIHTKCFAGYMSNVYQSKITKDKIVYNGIYGRKGNTVFLVSFGSSTITARIIEDNDDAGLSFLARNIKVPAIMSFKHFEGDGEDVIVWDSPIMKVYKVERVGSLSFM
ncbi:hypothetical protein [Aeromonas jandaei]|uniref:hypothetical protein n=1 Tax=Aeromonas jandaei TaxID=650 RepID=UPI001ADDA71F|nr:hypothetical protein [Aeromonas jandaei]